MMPVIPVSARAAKGSIAAFPSLISIYFQHNCVSRLWQVRAARKGAADMPDASSSVLPLSSQRDSPRGGAVTAPARHMPLVRTTASKALRESFNRTTSRLSAREEQPHPINILNAANADRRTDPVSIRCGRVLPSRLACYNGITGNGRGFGTQWPNIGIHAREYGDLIKRPFRGGDRGFRGGSYGSGGTHRAALTVSVRYGRITANQEDCSARSAAAIMRFR